MAIPLPVLVLYCADPLLTRAFYECLGLEFEPEPERHGSGPPHHVFSQQGFVLELYPARKRPGDIVPGPDGRQSMIFEIERFDETVAALRAMETEMTEVRVHNRDKNLRHVTVLDPDKRTLLLFEQDPDAHPPTLH